MPFGKDKGFCNQGGELMRVHEENALLRARVAELEGALRSIESELVPGGVTRDELLEIIHAVL